MGRECLYRRALDIAPRYIVLSISGHDYAIWRHNYRRLSRVEPYNTSLLDLGQIIRATNKSEPRPAEVVPRRFLSISFDYFSTLPHPHSYIAFR